MYKICIDGGFTCPNRDGTLGYGGCIFCSEGGSGEYAESSSLSVAEQIRLGHRQTAGKYDGKKYIAYFQAFTNTYGPVEHLRSLYEQAIAAEEIAAVSIGTRPDCLPENVLDLLEELNQIKPVFLEMGFQTCHDRTAEYIHRGYPSSVFADAVQACHRRGLRVTAHVILNLPGESPGMQYDTIRYINRLPVSGLKISMLYILRNTALAQIYETQPFSLYTMEEYVDCAIGCLERLRPDVTVERLTGDAPGNLLIAPDWIPHKHAVLNRLNHEMKVRNTWQGRLYEK